MIGHLMGDLYVANGRIAYNGRVIPARSFGINYGMLQTLGIKIKEGRSFSKSFRSNNSQIIINEAAAEALGLKDPVGTVINGKDHNTEIVGVVKNFNFQSLHEKIEPMKFYLTSDGKATIVVKIERGKEKEALNSLETLHKKFNPEAFLIISFWIGIMRLYIVPKGWSPFYHATLPGYPY